MNSGILELDLHGLNQYGARVRVDAALKKAGPGIYRIRLIHGYQGGTALRNLVRSRYRSHPKVLRLECGLNPGVTELVLREF